MNTRIFVGLATAATLLLSGCSSSEVPPAAETSCADQGPDNETAKELVERCTPDASIPEPDEAQAEALVESLDAIAPGLADDPEGTVDSARNMCTSILGGGQNLTAAAKARFADDAESMTDDQATQIIDAIRDEPWCS